MTSLQVENFIPTQIAGTLRPPGFTHLLTLLDSFDNHDWNSQNDKSRILYSRYVLARFNAFVFYLVGIFPLHLLFFCCSHTLHFVVRPWCGGLKICSGFQFADVRGSQWAKVQVYIFVCVYRLKSFVSLSRSTDFHRCSHLKTLLSVLDCLISNYLPKMHLGDISQYSEKNGCRCVMVVMLLLFSGERNKKRCGRAHTRPCGKLTEQNCSP